MAIWRILFGFGGMLSVLLLAVGAVDYYDEGSIRFNPDTIYQDGGLFTEPVAHRRYDDYMTYRLLKSLPANEMQIHASFYKPINTFEDKDYLSRQLIDEPEKRFTKSLTEVNSAFKPKSPVVSQAKSNNRKNRPVTSQMVCYFKLCAFRVPES